MIQPDRLKKLLQRMVDIYSPSGKESDLLDYLRGFFKRRGHAVIAQPVDGNRYNLILAPPENGIRLALIGHVDTVPAFDFDNYGFTEQAGLVRGLGAADMKGGCAAMIEAYLAFCESGAARPPVALCLVVGEEENGDGAHMLMREYHFPWAIIGEPTELKPCLESYGYLECQLTARGRRMHASLARPTSSAIEVLLRAVLQLSQQVFKNRPDLVYNIRDIHSSQAGFAVPARCEAWLDIHVPPRIPLADIVAQIEEMVPIASQRKPGVDLNFRAATIDAGYELPPRGPVISALQSAFATNRLPWSTDAFRSHSDANQIWAAGAKPVLLGPGRLEQAHSEEESVDFEQVCQAARLYLDTMLAVGADTTL